jgi:hypothetical protein
MRASWGQDDNLLRRRIVRVAIGASSLLIGCSIDDRTLTTAPPPHLGAGGKTSSDGGSPSYSAGSAGTSPQDHDIPVCVYDGDEQDDDCNSLVDNAGFATGTTPWEPSPGALRNWAELDATDLDGSGSIRVLNFLHGTTEGVAPGAAEQCVSTDANATYDLAGDVYIPEGQGAGLYEKTYTGQAGLGLFFFESPDCTGNSIGNFDSELVSDVGSWLHLEASTKAPPLTRSMFVRLNTLMPFREYKFEAHFDNVLVRQR